MKSSIYGSEIGSIKDNRSCNKFRWLREPRDYGTTTPHVLGELSSFGEVQIFVLFFSFPSKVLSTSLSVSKLLTAIT